MSSATTKKCPDCDDGLNVNGFPCETCNGTREVVLEQEAVPFIQSCEHGKLSGQRCRECNRNVPYGPKP